MIDIFFSILRKGLVATIALIFAFVIIYVPQEYGYHHTVPETQAFLGTDLLNLVQNTIQAVVSVALKLKEFVLDGIAWTLAKAIVAKMVSSLVDWINSGFKGSPSFVTDFGKLVLDAADETVGKFIEEQGGDASFLCEPFKLDIQIALAVEYENVREDKPYEGCKISDFIGDVKEFYKGNFEEGGWQNWIKVTAEPEKYTAYGQQIEAEKAVARKVAKAETETKTVTGWGNGFKSVKQCKDETTSSGVKSKCTIVLPGKPVADQLAKSLGAGQDTLVTADEISEIVGALFAQLANKAITGVNGLLGLSKGTGHTDSGYSGGSYTSAANAQADNLVTQAQNNNGNISTSTYNQSPSTAYTENPTFKAVNDAITVQQNYKDLADIKVLSFQIYLSNSKNPTNLKNLATQYLNEARGVQQNVPGYLAALDPIGKRFATLEAELQDPTITPDRVTQIKQEEATLTTTFNSLVLYTQAQLDTSTQNWSQF